MRLSHFLPKTLQFISGLLGVKANKLTKSGKVLHYLAPSTSFKQGGLEFFSSVQHSQDQNGLLFIFAWVWLIELCPKNNIRHLWGAGLIAQLVNSLPAMQVTLARFLGWEDPLKKEMSTHSNILAWRISWTEEPGRLLSLELQESDAT